MQIFTEDLWEYLVTIAKRISLNVFLCMMVYISVMAL